MTAGGARIQMGATGVEMGATGTERAAEPTAAEDDRLGFEHWYRAEHPRLLAALTVACGDPHLAQDATAEAFARALASWRRVGIMDAPAGWAYRVGVNVLRRRARRAAKESQLLDRLGPRAAPPSDQDAVELWHAVGQLPRRERLAVALRYAGGLTEAEVATAMGVAVGTASATLNRARRRLATALDDDTEFPKGRRGDD